MSESAPVHEHIFLFVIGNSKNVADKGYAKVLTAFRRGSQGTLEEALKEIEQGDATKSWEPAASTHAPRGIDLAFDPAQPCLVFVAISGDHSHVQDAAEDGVVGPLHDAATYFGDKIVTPLAIEGMPESPIITDAKQHKLPGSKHPTVCSFVVDASSALDKAKNAGSYARFPIVFDFVDSDDAISPVFKKPRPPKEPHAPGTELPMLNHGGIHPPNGASMIEFFE
jgi:hypothetical protein